MTVTRIAIEAVAIAILLTVLLLARQHASVWVRAAERGLGRIGQRPTLAVALIGLLAFAASAILSLVGRMPYPRVHDEFSYLLAADTFARGRVTNPTHPMWVHFESIHIIQQPTYASKYPPAHGLMLAVGQVIGGHPVVGVWISTAIAAAAVSWMLLAWLPPWWAMLGSLLAVLHPGILIYWSQGYIGGAVAMTGGALVFGAMRRIVRQPRIRDAVLMGIGLAVLANSRPYEGLVATMPVAVVLIAWMFSKNGPPVELSLRRIMLPICAVLAVTGIAMGYYNFRVTGSALRMPYLVHEATYATAPFFLWQRPRLQPPYRHEIIRHHHAAALEHYLRQQSLWGLVSASARKAKDLWRFYYGYHSFSLALVVPLLMLPWVLRDRWGRFALLTCGVLLPALALETWVSPHYAAPITGLVFVILLQGIRHLRVWNWCGRPVGRYFVWTICAIAIGTFILAFAQRTRINTSDWGFGRARILAELKENGRRHLVIVRYGPLYSKDYRWAYWEWVYNEADIDGAKVVWAREMDDRHNRKLLEYFKDRDAWLLELAQHDSPPKLVPYPVQSRPTIWYSVELKTAS